MTNFLYLPGWEVTGVQDRASEYRATAAYTPEPDACLKCGTLGELYRHGVKITDSPRFRLSVLTDARSATNATELCAAGFRSAPHFSVLTA